MKNERQNYLTSIRGVMFIGDVVLQWVRDPVNDNRYAGQQDGRPVKFESKQETSVGSWRPAISSQDQLFMSLSRYTRSLKYPHLDPWRPFSAEDIKEFGRS